MDFNTALYKASKSYWEILNYLSRNFGALKNIIENGSTGGADIPSIQTAIEDGTLTTINTKKLRIYAEQMLPMSANSMYFLQSDLNPGQIASHTVNQFAWFRIADVGGNIPTGISGFKFKYAVSSTANATGSNVIYAVQAAWVDGNNTTEGYGTAVPVTTTLDETSTAKYVTSALSNEVTIGGTRGTGKDLYVEIYRDAVSASDDYAANAKLTFVDVEFVMAQ